MIVITSIIVWSFDVTSFYNDVTTITFNVHQRYGFYVACTYYLFPEKGQEAENLEQS